ncbi:hypothetical protein CkaCkLH20_01996 [Colletotrichum karsti]|uniref:Uncharacterized protein n=1 Tax=Colletotrichum karsti TaxID=1095194 RepID=A0A9P6IDP7_9PEZI|nr:uncharacterized protein CkaCkLH20_01996 [Colletotrichum karsti]KAF9880954.1 hypothetical protein CkaCkLH20_01996 [Colletotrichum karsti]
MHHDAESDDTALTNIMISAFQTLPGVYRGLSIHLNDYKEIVGLNLDKPKCTMRDRFTDARSYIKIHDYTDEFLQHGDGTASCAHATSTTRTAPRATPALQWSPISRLKFDLSNTEFINIPISCMTVVTNRNISVYIFVLA